MKRRVGIERADAGGTLGAVRLSRIGVVVLVALAGLVLAAAISYAASRLVSQPIGLISEPVGVGESLAPVVTSVPVGTTTTPAKKKSRTSTTPATVAPPVTQAPPPVTRTVRPPAQTAPATTRPPVTTTGDDDSPRSDSHDQSGRDDRRDGGDHDADD